MSIHRRAAQRDVNEPQIIAAFRGRFWVTVQHTKYDLDAACPRCKSILAIEVKNPERTSQRADSRQTVSQKQLIANGWPLHFVRTAEDVAALILEHRTRCRA